MRKELVVSVKVTLAKNIRAMKTRALRRRVVFGVYGVQIPHAQPPVEVGR